MASGVDGKVPTFAEDIMDSKELNRALEYMGLEEGMPITDIPVQHVFIGSCTNSTH